MCCTPGDRICKPILTCTALFQLVVFRQTTLRWIHPKHPFFLPVKVLSRVFRGKFVAGLKRLFRRKNSASMGVSKIWANPSFSCFSAALFRQDWVVYAKPPFGGPEHVLQYLARYTHRVAISNHRLVSLADGNVTFRWKDYAHGNKKRRHDRHD